MVKQTFHATSELNLRGSAFCSLWNRRQSLKPSISYSIPLSSTFVCQTKCWASHDFQLLTSNLLLRAFFKPDRSWPCVFAYSSWSWPSWLAECLHQHANVLQTIWERLEAKLLRGFLSPSNLKIKNMKDGKEEQWSCYEASVFEPYAKWNSPLSPLSSVEFVFEGYVYKCPTPPIGFPFPLAGVVLDLLFIDVFSSFMLRCVDHLVASLSQGISLLAFPT